jgi:predicted  nucleic acid-binding Zn-ribbon protein
MESIIDKLKAEKEDWIASVNMRYVKYITLKKEVQRLEQHTRELKTQRNKAYKELGQAKKKVIKLDKKIKTLPSQLRSRTKANMGKAINKIMGE